MNQLIRAEQFASEAQAETASAPPYLLDQIAERGVVARPDTRDEEIARLKARVSELERECGRLYSAPTPSWPPLMRFGRSFVDAEWYGPGSYINVEPGLEARTAANICVCGDARCQAGPFVERK